MNSRRTELAAAARKTAALARNIPEPDRPDVAGRWAALLDEIEDLSDREAIPAILCWRDAMVRDLRDQFPDANEERWRI